MPYLSPSSRQDSQPEGYRHRRVGPDSAGIATGDRRTQARVALAILGLVVALGPSGCGFGESGERVTSRKSMASRTRKPAAGSRRALPDTPSVDPAEAVASESASVAHLSGRRSDRPQVVFESSLGDIVVELNPSAAPQTVANFLDYVDQGAYDGSILHQVVAGYLVLGGGYDEELSPLPAGPTIPNEAANDLAHHRGTLAMARPLGAIDGAARQFFFNLADNPLLEHRGDTPETFGYCVFGQVVAGWDVLERIAAVPVESRGRFQLLPREPIVIRAVRRAETELARAEKIDARARAARVAAEEQGSESVIRSSSRREARQVTRRRLAR